MALSWDRLKRFYLKLIASSTAVRSYCVRRAREYASGLLAFFRIHGSALLSFLGAILAVVSLIAAAYSVLLIWKLLEGIGVALAAIGAFISSIQQSKASEELSRKNDLLISLQKEASDKLTGGSDYCYLMIAPDKESRRECISVFPPWKNPIYDVRIQYSDSTIAASHSEAHADGLYKSAKAGRTFNAVGTATYDVIYRFQVIQPIGFFKLRDFNMSRLPFVINARFDARNGRWHQTILLEAGTDGKIASADFVVRILPRPPSQASDCEVLHKRVSTNFSDPEKIFVRNQNGDEIVSGIPFCCLSRNA